MCKTVLCLHRCPPSHLLRRSPRKDHSLPTRCGQRFCVTASDDIFSDDFLAEDAQNDSESGESVEDPPTELILKLKRRGHGWGEEIVPYVTVEWRPIYKQKRPRFRSQGPGPWEEGSIECELIGAGVPKEAVEKVVAAAAAWRVTPGGRPLIDRRRVARVQRNAAGVIGYLTDVCGIPLGSKGVGGILMKAPQILLSKVTTLDRWNIRVIELAAFMHIHGHSNVPADWKISPTLARWVQRQRECRNKGELNEERVQILNALGFSFGDGRIRFGYDWRKRLDAYVNWMMKLKERGRWSDSTGISWARIGGWHAAQLAAWAMEQRELRRMGWLPVECIDRMDYFHFDWEISTDDDKTRRWLQRFGRLAVEIKKFRASIERSRSYSLEDITLIKDDTNGAEAVEGRSRSTSSKGNERRLSSDWYHRPIDRISFEEGMPKLDRMKGMQLTQDIELWLEEQRYLWKLSELSFEKITLLYALGLDLDPYGDRHWTKLAHLSTSFLNNFHIEAHLDADAEDDLRQINGSWLLMPEDIVSVTRGGDVVERIDFKTFHAMKDEVNVVAMDAPAPSLSSTTAVDVRSLKDEKDEEMVRWNVEEWIRTQRAVFKEGRLGQDRMEYMAILGLTWTLSDEIVEMSDEKWRIYFQRLSSPESSEDLPRLKEFTFYQRALHRIGCLKRERIDALHSVDFSFDFPEKTEREREWDERISDVLRSDADDDDQTRRNAARQWLSHNKHKPFTSNIQKQQIQALNRHLQ